MFPFRPWVQASNNFFSYGLTDPSGLLACSAPEGLKFISKINFDVSINLLQVQPALKNNRRQSPLQFLRLQVLREDRRKSAL